MEGNYVDFGSYPPYETQQLLDAFVKNNVRFIFQWQIDHPLQA
jgi:hypothetical protein